MQPLGFRLKPRRNGIIAAESLHCRVLFRADTVFPMIQRVGDDPKLAHRPHPLHLILKACGYEDEFQLAPIHGPETVKFEVDRMLTLLAEQCGPILSGDPATWARLDELAAEADNDAFEQLGQLGIRLKQDGKWRELPELESVEAKGPSRATGMLAALVLLPLPAVFIILLILTLGAMLIGKHTSEDLPYALIACVISVPAIYLVIWVIRKMFGTQYQWQTDSEGLTIAAFRRKHFLRWREIEVSGVRPGVGYEFRTPQGTIRLDKEALQNTALEASIWQHLNRVGKAGDIIPSDFAMSLWAEIPDDRMESIQWESPLPIHVPDIVLRFVALEVLIWGATLYFKLDPVPIAALFSWWPVVWAGSRLIGIRRISVDDHGISAVTALGKRTIPWAQVHSVKFVNPGIRQPASLQIRGRGLKFLRIPWIPQHPNSTRVMLSILRRLRQQDRFKLLPFPTVLLTTGHIEDQP